MITYHVRMATEADFDACLELRRLTEVSLRNAGVDQWHDSAEGRRVIRRWFDREEMRVVTTHAGDVIAGFAIGPPDQQFWTEAEAREPAIYLYKMMIRPDRRGSGLGDAILDYAAAYGERNNAELLRIDCWKTNNGLHRYFTERGFAHVDTRTAEGRNSGWLAQRRITARHADGRIQLVEADPVVPPQGDRYDDPISVTWCEARDEVTDLRDQMPVGTGAYAALEQAVRALDVRAREQRQRNGMAHRPYNGQPR